MFVVPSLTVFEKTPCATGGLHCTVGLLRSDNDAATAATGRTELKQEEDTASALALSGQSTAAVKHLKGTRSNAP